jgi:hypothetical protein
MHIAEWAAPNRDRTESSLLMDDAILLRGFCG